MKKYQIPGHWNETPIVKAIILLRFVYCAFLLANCSAESFVSLPWINHVLHSININYNQDRLGMADAKMWWRYLK